jgi:hypothetical protein
VKTFKIISITVLAIIAVLGIVIVVQPSEAHIEKSIIINAPASSIFPEISNYKNFNVWSPWARMDPEVKQTLKGADASLGSRMNWNRPKQWIEEIEENKRVKNGISFGDYDGKFYSEFTLTAEGERTRVTWTYDGTNNDLGRKAMWVIMGTMLSSQYEQGLRDLKKVVESKAAL